MGYRRQLLLVVAFVLWAPVTSRAQVQVFSNTALFEPQIDVVSSGVVMDVQATVSADRKYVTMNMRATNSQLLNLFVFQFQQGGGFVQLPGGVVGGVNPVIAGAAAGNGASQLNAPMRVGAGNGGVILLKRGITPLIAGR